MVARHSVRQRARFLSRFPAERVVSCFPQSVGWPNSCTWNCSPETAKQARIVSLRRAIGETVQ